MANPSYERDVEEQLAEALPVLGQATLKQDLAGLHRLLESCPTPVHQKFLIWLWTEAPDRFDAVSLGQQDPGLRIWLPSDDGDLAVATGQAEQRVDIDPVTTVTRRHSSTSTVIEIDPRAAAANLLSQLERTHANAGRRPEA